MDNALGEPQTILLLGGTRDKDGGAYVLFLTTRPDGGTVFTLLKIIVEPIPVPSKIAPVPRAA